MFYLCTVVILLIECFKSVIYELLTVRMLPTWTVGFASRACIDCTAVAESHFYFIHFWSQIVSKCLPQYCVFQLGCQGVLIFCSIMTELENTATHIYSNNIYCLSFYVSLNRTGSLMESFCLILFVSHAVLYSLERFHCVLLLMSNVFLCETTCFVYFSHFSLKSHFNWKKEELYSMSVT